MTRTRPIWWAMLLFAAAGCTSDYGRRDGRHDDPLIGGGSRPGNQPVAVVQANPPAGGATLQPPTYGPQPALTPTSNAALAAGGFQPLPGSNDLRIGSNSPTLGAPPAGVALQPPAFSAPKPVGGVAPAPPPNFAPAARGQLETAIAATNPNWVRLTYNGQSREYTFSVSVPNRLNTSVPRVVEATAATEEQAIREALGQLGQN